MNATTAVTFITQLLSETQKYCPDLKGLEFAQFTQAMSTMYDEAASRQSPELLLRYTLDSVQSMSESLNSSAKALVDIDKGGQSSLAKYTMITSLVLAAFGLIASFRQEFKTMAGLMSSNKNPSSPSRRSNGVKQCRKSSDMNWNTASLKASVTRRSQGPPRRLTNTYLRASVTASEACIHFHMTPCPCKWWVRHKRPWAQVESATRQ